MSDITKNTNNIIPEEDGKVLTEKIMPFFGLTHLRVDYSPSKKTFPDIWISTGDVPVITVTDEWKKQTSEERQKRLVHEILHASGLVHNKRLGYTSKPETDTLSKRIYEVVMKHKGEPPKVLKLSRNLALRRRK